MKNWKHRELSTSEHGMVVALFLIGVAIIMACCSGCSTARRNMYMGQGLDVATTYYALNYEDGFSEGNALLGDMKGVIIGKVVMVSFVEWLAWGFPDKADTIHEVGAWFGYAPACYNAYQIGTH